jgi:hypothetical protein
MTDLIAKIRSAQIRAGEDVVINHLRQMDAGLLQRATNQTEKPSPDDDRVGQKDKLRPCPFCGDEMGLPPWNFVEEDRVSWYVVCPECSAMGPRANTDDDDRDAAITPEDDAIMKWNARIG